MKNRRDKRRRFFFLLDHLTDRGEIGESDIIAGTGTDWVWESLQQHADKPMTVDTVEYSGGGGCAVTLYHCTVSNSGQWTGSLSGQ